MNIMQMRRGMGVHISRPKYIPVEYIIPLTQYDYFDIGFVDDGTYTIKTSIDVSTTTPVGTYGFIYSSSRSWKRGRAFRVQQGNQLYFWYSGVEKFYDKSNNRMIVVDAPTRVTVNNTVLWSNRTSAIQPELNSMYILSPISNINISPKIYNFSIEKGGVVYRNMIPVKVNNKGAMYDFVTKEIFYNAGSGGFLCGPEIN